MTDKVQKIREEVERLKGWNNNVRNSTRQMTLQEEDFNRGKHSSYLEILNFIDSLQEESQVKESAELQHVNETCKENGNSLTQEPAINVWHDMSEDAENGRNIIIIDTRNFYGAVLRRSGQQLRKNNREG